MNSATDGARRWHVLTAGVSLLAVVIFAVDWLTPLGVAGGVPYIACVLIAARLADRRFILTVATATSVLTLLAFALAPAGPSPFWIVATNRMLALAAIWITAGLLIAYERSQEKLRIEQKTGDLLHAISASALETPTVESALQVALDQICSFSGWPVGHVWACESNGEIIPIDIWHLEDPDQFETFRQVTQSTHLESGAGLPGRVLATGRSAWSADVTRDDNFPGSQLAGEIGVRGRVAIPILEDDELTYVLEFFSSEVAEPDDTLQAVLAYAGTQFGQTIRRKRSGPAAGTGEGSPVPGPGGRDSARAGFRGLHLAPESRWCGDAGL